MSGKSTFLAYGARWRSDYDLELFHPGPASPGLGEIDVHGHHGAEPPVRQVLSGNGRSFFLSDGFRFQDSDVATMETVGAATVNIYPGRLWDGSLPQSFYGTLTGALFAWRGGLTIHGSAVEVDGKALVVCGSAGSGKSSIAAALISRGARLLSDDLTVLHPASPGLPPLIYAGRRCIRLFPSTAADLRSTTGTTSIRSVGPKELVVPESVEPTRPIPLAGIIMLGMSQGEFASESLEERLDRLWFRPRLFKCIRGYRFRKTLLTSVLETVKLRFCPSFGTFSGISLRDVAEVIHNGWQNTV